MSFKHLLKPAFQHSVRGVHAVLLDRGLPSKIGICLHSLAPSHYAAFREMVQALRAQGYRFVSPDELLEPTDEKRALISFDDNYRSWYEALSLLDALGVQATFYTNTSPFRDRADAAEITAYFDRLGRRAAPIPLSTDELRALQAAGHLIGGHTHAHHRLSTLPLSQAREEIRRNKVELEDLLGTAVQHFSYPYGMRRYFSEALRDYAAEIGFRTVANAIPGLQHTEQHPLHLNRSVWELGHPLAYNLRNLRIDGRTFERFTGRSAVG